MKDNDIHQNYKLIVWTKFKVDQNIKEDFLRDKLQTRFEKIIPFIRMDSLMIQEEKKNDQT